MAAAFDLAFDDVRTARVFDPSRKLPGDVQAFHKLEPVVAVEVRARPVTYSDVVQFASSASAAAFPHALIAGFDSVEAEVLHLPKEAWQETGVFVTVHPQFSDILLDALVWSRRPLLLPSSSPTRSSPFTLTGRRSVSCAWEILGSSVFMCSRPGREAWCQPLRTARMIAAPTEVPDGA